MTFYKTNHKNLEHINNRNENSNCDEINESQDNVLKEDEEENEK